MREVVEKDSHHRDTIWVPSRNAWEESGKIISSDSFKLLWTAILLHVKKNCPHQGWPWWRSLSWWLWHGFWWRRWSQLWPTTTLGSSWLASHAASSWNPYSSKVRELLTQLVLFLHKAIKINSVLQLLIFATLLLFKFFVSLLVGLATSMTLN